MNKSNVTTLAQILDIEHPIILAPMFLVSNAKMTIEALKSGITAAIPALNYRTISELENAIIEIKNASSKPFGINLIVNKSNIKLKEQLYICCRHKISFIITSLGNPKEVINEAQRNDIKVFCDVTDLNYALKVEKMGADGLIAVSEEAGGHSGNLKFMDLINLLKSNCKIPIISAGGVSSSIKFLERMNLGIAGVSIGTIFIASEESPVSHDYKQACIDYKAKDIVLTTKLSGTPCTVINTPYIQEIGTEQSNFEKFLNTNRRLKKWFKLFTSFFGMKSLQNAAFGQTYKTVWCAGTSIEDVHAILPISQIVKNLTKKKAE
jgi:nitronate monooxygenase